MKTLWLTLAVIAVGLVFLEIGLRAGFGFGNPPLYIGNEKIGYLLAPNQKLKRFGNRIEINEYSMRAGAIAPRPDQAIFRAFLLGDSLANGNGWTDQANILSARIAHYLAPSLPAGYDTVEAINASANSWGPRNELAYLERYGTFGASALVLLLNTDDLFGTQPSPLQVGRDRGYPDKKPPLAIIEILNRFKQPQPIPGLKEIQNEAGDRVGKNLIAISGIHQKAVTSDSKFILVLSPLKRELPGPRDYELVARQRLTDWASEADALYVDLLETYQKHPAPERLYRDHIHLSPEGNELVGEAIAKATLTLFKP